MVVGGQVWVQTEVGRLKPPLSGEITPRNSVQYLRHQWSQPRLRFPIRRKGLPEMRAFLVLVQVVAPFTVLALNTHDSPVAPTPEIFGDGTGLYEQWPRLGSVPLNRTEGSIRSGKRQFNNLLESRQSNVNIFFLSFNPSVFGSPGAK